MHDQKPTEQRQTYFLKPTLASRQWLVYSCQAVITIFSSVFIVAVGQDQGLSLPKRAGEIAPIKIAQTDKRAEAERLTNEGWQLFEQGTAESLQQAIEKLETALPLWREVGDQSKEALINLALGRTHNLLGFNQKALDYYDQALPLYRKLEDRSGEAGILNNIGLVYSELGENQQALEYFQQALALFQAVGDRSGEAAILNNIGGVYADLGEKQQALDYLQQALALSQAVGDRALEAQTLTNIGQVYYDLGEKKQALEYYQQALPLRRAVGDRAEEAATLRDISRVYYDLGEKKQALEYYQQALPLSQALGDRTGEATILNNIGLVYSDLGEKQQALEYYQQALPLRRAVGDRTGEATTLNNIGAVYSDLGEKQQALEYYQQALSLSQALGDRAEEAAILNNIGRVYQDLGEKQQALEYYQQSLPLSQAVGDRAGEAKTLSNIGGVYSELGEKQRALEYYQQALSLSQAVDDRALEAVTLSNIGLVYSDLGEKQQALEYYQQALPLSQAVGDRAQEAATLNNIGMVYLNLGEKQQALEYLQQALSLSQAVEDRAGEAGPLNNIGGVYSDLGEKQRALEYSQQALPLRRAVGDRTGEALTLYNIAITERNLGNLQLALTQMQASIDIIEDLRTKVASPELRQTYFATVQNYYQFYIDLLMQLHQQNPDQGYDKLAFHASEGSRARTLLELLTEANANIREGVDPDLLQQEQNLNAKLDATEKQRIEIYSNPESTPAQKTAIEQQRQQLLADYQQLQDQIRATSPKYAALQYPQPLTLEQVQQQILDEDTILLQYAFGIENSYLWAVTKDSLTSYQLPARGEIETLARRFYSLLQIPGYEIGNSRGIAKVVPRDNLNSVAQLSELLFGQVAEQLTKKRIVVVADGALQYIPFAALATPETSDTDTPTPLINQYELVNLPSSSTLAIIRDQINGRQEAPQQLAILADPVFTNNDNRLKTASNRGTEPDLNQLLLNRSVRVSEINLSRLPGTRTEAEAILNLVASATQVNAFDFDANRSFIDNPQLRDYQIIHLATHGILNSEAPELSGVVLSLVDEQGNSQNGFLRLHDIFNLNLPAELVVLSACQTGLGEEIRGEGLVGLTRGFMYAGAPRLVVSLWNVDDAATAEFMTRFYQLMLNDGLKPAQALRETQLQMQGETQWKSPYYWAAFTLQGEWN
ncbi:MAG: tetratricopeptide repeat protein [Coleofasciculus sp. G3-WIS-01]|uniref:CHAT domain-containing tetratricopeptide repeat protein n=1 Tax=Coleofasciculus sp. G3-WIS-01 TaxID=3069528 RepID=UPI0032F31454